MPIKKELHDWFSKYEEQLDKTKKDNRVSKTQFVAQMNAKESGTKWNKVSKLCEFASSTPRSRIAART